MVLNNQQPEAVGKTQRRKNERGSIMAAIGSPEYLYPNAIETNSIGVRCDIVSMMLPFFPEDQGLTEFTTKIGDHTLRMYCESGSDFTLATSSDRRILNLLAGAVARNIRAGQRPCRHVTIETRSLLKVLTSDGIIGGSEYQRIVTSLNRLMATVVETEAPLGDSASRHKRFRWIDGYEHDDSHVPGGRKIVRLRISISEQAFVWMTRSMGYDLTREEFRAITASRSSIWRIYEICLATLLEQTRHHPRPTSAFARIDLDELRRRVPISSELKVFKSRTLRTAMLSISAHPEMSRHIALSLEQRHEARFRQIDHSRKARLDSIVVRIDRGPGPLPSLNRIIPSVSGLSAQLASETGGEPMEVP